MKTVKKVVLSFSGLLLVLATFFSLAVLAQTPLDFEQGQAGVGAFGLADSPPAGYQTLYMFAGVRNKSSSGKIATVVHCTNYGTTNLNVIVQFFDRTGSISYPVTKNSLAPNNSWTFSTQSTNLYGANQSPISTTVDINQGSGRVIAQNGTKLLCAVQLLDAVNSPPNFTAKVALFDSNGNCVGSLCHPLLGGEIYLPLLLK